MNLTEKISINKNAHKLVNKVIRNKEFLRVEVEKKSGATIIDAGIKALGSYSAGSYVTEICLGGLGKASLTYTMFEKTYLPAVAVETNYPVIATLGAQFAGWSVNINKYFAMGSGPGRALALKPKKMFNEINYKDDSKIAVIVLETSEFPPTEVLEYIADECNVELRDLYITITPTCSLAGSVQISGRVLETGIHKLLKVGFDVSKIIHGYGLAPIAPLHSDATICMGRTNDALNYGGITSYVVDYEDDEELVEIVSKVPSSTSKDYGKPFYDVFKAANFDFYKIDSNLFAPATIYVNNIRSGKTFKFGRINDKVLIESLGIVQ